MSLKRDLLAVILLVGLEPPTQAHDMYSHLRDRLGGSCCDEKDCRPAPYRVTATGVRMFVDGEWIVVPDYMIQYRALLGDTGETAGGHCYRMGYATRCAVLPPNATEIFELSFARREGHIRPVP